jgi:hypothetical protein
MARVPHRRDLVQANTQSDDAIPEMLPEPCHTKKTIELCGHEHGRMRCTRTKDHDGQHESLSLEGPNRW